MVTLQKEAVSCFFRPPEFKSLSGFPPLVAFFISFFTSMGGVSGAFLLLPFQERDEHQIPLQFVFFVDL